MRFEGVHFSYERGRAVLRGLDLDVPAGTMLGLVGKSGGGKSTTINLLCRFFTPDAGRITVNGLDLATLDLNAWRGHIGLVPQEPFLFHASILDNIRYAKPDASFADIVAAARAAHAHEFTLKKPDGYDALVGEGGITLSGGERQRIAIARAILADPPLSYIENIKSQEIFPLVAAMTFFVSSRLPVSTMTTSSTKGAIDCRHRSITFSTFLTIIERDSVGDIVPTIYLKIRVSCPEFLSDFDDLAIDFHHRKIDREMIFPAFPG